MIHNKVISEELHKMIGKLIPEYRFDDSSYGNDDTDSIMCEELGIQIFFPNFIDYTTFALQYIDSDDIEIYDNVYELVRRVNRI
jgi:hypothetical protein